MADMLGMLTMEELRQLVQDRTIDTVAVVFSDLYGRLLGKRYDADHFLSDVSRHGAHACNYLLTADMEMEPVQGYAYTNWEQGYGDFELAPDLQTLRIAAWLNRTAIVLCDVAEPAAGDGRGRQSHVMVPYAPRSILRQAISRAEDAGYWAMAASEMEYYLFRDSYTTAAAKGYDDLQPYGHYLEDYHMLQGTREEVFHGAVRRFLKASGVPVESSKGEWGKGQHELNIRYTDILAMADRHTVFKQCLKETGELMGSSVTFMAKLDAGQAGSSCHIHLSLWNDEGNAFVGDETVYQEDETKRGRRRRRSAAASKASDANTGKTVSAGLTASPEFRWFLGGLLTYLPDFMVFYAPTVNAYKRYQSGSWAPTRIAWSRDNRTAGVRVVGSGQSLRIESRVPGADCNPYLTYAAALFSGLEGIANRIEPPAPFDGDVYQAGRGPGAPTAMPMTLRDATDRFESSKFVRQALGDDVADHYAHFFRTEQALFDQAVTDWERRRYFEQI
jgi:glutamine synthetase